MFTLQTEKGYKGFGRYVTASHDHSSGNRNPTRQRRSFSIDAARRRNPAASGSLFHAHSKPKRLTPVNASAKEFTKEFSLRSAV